MMTDEAADRLRLPQLWAIIKKRSNKKRKSWQVKERVVKVIRPVLYDADGRRMVYDDDEEDDGVEDEENGEWDEDEEGEEEREGEGEDDSQDDDDYEDDSDGDGDDDIVESSEMQAMRQRTDENNERIKQNNIRDEEILQEKERNKKKHRNVMVRTLSGKKKTLKTTKMH